MVNQNVSFRKVHRNAYFFFYLKRNVPHQIKLKTKLRDLNVCILVANFLSHFFGKQLICDSLTDRNAIKHQFIEVSFCISLLTLQKIEEEKKEMFILAYCEEHFKRFIR